MSTVSTKMDTPKTASEIGEAERSIVTSNVVPEIRQDLDWREVLARLGAGLAFLLALRVALSGWSMIGGPDHFDITPWYWKLLLCGGWAVAAARILYSAATQRRIWNPDSRRWVVSALALMLVMGTVTYYYHLQEPQEEEAGDEEPAAQL